MKTRKVLAAATLAALPLFVGAVQPRPHPGADAARERHVTERPSGPRWAYFTGNGLDPAMIECLLQGGWTGARCVVAAL